MFGAVSQVVRLFPTLDVVKAGRNDMFGIACREDEGNVRRNRRQRVERERFQDQLWDQPPWRRRRVRSFPNRSRGSIRLQE